jgi:hypothetical protein
MTVNRREATESNRRKAIHPAGRDLFVTGFFALQRNLGKT